MVSDTYSCIASKVKTIFVQVHYKSLEKFFVCVVLIHLVGGKTIRPRAFQNNNRPSKCFSILSNKIFVCVVVILSLNVNFTSKAIQFDHVQLFGNKTI